MNRWASREWLAALVLAVVGVVRLFTTVDDAQVEQWTNVVIMVVPVAVFTVMRVWEKIKSK